MAVPESIHQLFVQCRHGIGKSLAALKISRGSYRLFAYEVDCQVLNIQCATAVPFPFTALSHGASLPKRPSDSFVECLLPLAGETRLQYINADDSLRVGRLLQDLDILAAVSAYSHCVDCPSVSIVTASVEHLRLKSGAVPNTLRLNAMVTSVGRSSMEVSILMEDAESDAAIANAKIIMVARDKNSMAQSLPVPRLLPQNWDGQLQASTEILAAPTSKSSASLQLREAAPIKGTRISTLTICHPQHKNIHNFTFGGFLMSEAADVSAIAAKLYNSESLIGVFDVSFVRAVPIGSILAITACVAHSTGDRFCVFCTASLHNSAEVVLSMFTLWKAPEPAALFSSESLTAANVDRAKEICGLK